MFDPSAPSIGNNKRSLARVFHSDEAGLALVTRDQSDHEVASSKILHIVEHHTELVFILIDGGYGSVHLDEVQTAPLKLHHNT
jgi:hypothetical protein